MRLSLLIIVCLLLASAAGAPEDFKAVYANLKTGSENHLEAFDRVLNNPGGSRGSQNSQSGKGNKNRNPNNRANRGTNRK